jgi:hypothetical protein
MTFDREDYPFPNQCVAILNPMSDAKARRCGRVARSHVGDHFPACAAHAQYLDPAVVDSAAALQVEANGQRIAKLESELASAKGSAAEWRRLAMAKHGEAAVKEYRPVAARDSFVYFIKGGDFIKIGKADNPAIRYKQLLVGGVVAPDGVDFSQIQLLAVEPGGSEREGELHKKFAGLRVDGEWFSASPKLLRYIGDLPQISSPQWGELMRVEP